MNLAMYSLIGLIGLVILSYITSFAFHILNDRFYSVFHLTAGILSTFFFYSFTRSYILSIFFTELVGVLWEIFEWYQWKWILKKKKYQPQSDDTRNDLIVDFAGSLTGVALLILQ